LNETELSHGKQDATESGVHSWKTPILVSLMNQTQNLLSEGARGVKLRPAVVHFTKPEQHGDEVSRVLSALTEFTRPRERMFDLHGGIPFKGGQRGPESQVQFNFLLKMFGSVREKAEQLQRFRQQTSRFGMGAPMLGSLARLSQVVNCPLVISPLLKMRREFRGNFSRPLAIGGFFPLADPLMQ
jgi:hypothetical protein